MCLSGAGDGGQLFTIRADRFRRIGDAGRVLDKGDDPGRLQRAEFGAVLEQVRPGQHRKAVGGRFHRVVAAERHQRAAKEGDVSGAEQAFHLAKRVGDVERVVRCRLCAGRPPPAGHAGRLAQRRNIAAPVRVARGDHGEPVIAKQTGGPDGSLLFACMRRGGEKNPSFAGGAAQHRDKRLVRFCRSDRQLQRAAHLNGFRCRAKRDKALRLRLVHSKYKPRRAKHSFRLCPAFLPAGCRAIGQLRRDKSHRHAACCGCRDQGWPEIAFKKQGDPRPDPVQEGCHHVRMVERLVKMRHPE